MTEMKNPLPPWVERRLHESRVATLSTVDAAGRPHAIPICYAYDGPDTCFYSAVDNKPKKVPAERLVRVQNIQGNPHVALLISEYTESWEDLWYVLVRGKADLISAGESRARAVHLLKQKYPQYAVALPPAAPIIRVVPDRWTVWGTPRR